MHATVPTLVATKNTTIKLRITDDESTAWREQANGSLSAWIREVCNQACFAMQGKSIPKHSPITHEMVDREAARTYPQFATKPYAGRAVGTDDFEVRKPCKHGLLFCKKCK